MINNGAGVERGDTGPSPEDKPRAIRIRAMIHRIAAVRLLKANCKAEYQWIFGCRSVLLFFNGHT